MATYNVYSDPGHGWGRVRRSKLVKLGILDKITTYSFQRGEWVYLEEDQDLMNFILACRAAGEEPKFREFIANRESKIRNYECFKP